VVEVVEVRVVELEEEMVVVAVEVIEEHQNNLKEKTNDYCNSRMSRKIW